MRPVIQHRPTIGQHIDKMWEPEARRFQKMSADLKSKLDESLRTIERLEATLKAEREHVGSVIKPSTIFPGTKTTKFYHSGDLGDIIYACPTIKALGGGILVLGPEMRHHDSVRDKMTPEKAKSIGSLLGLQPYIDDVIYSETMPDDIDYDLNQMRSFFRSGHWNPKMTLSEIHLRAFKLSAVFDKVAWLHVSPAPETVGRVVISRSERYRNPYFRWRSVFDAYRDRMIFVGTKGEHQDFEINFGKIEKLDTPTLLDVARAIHGADLFIGNQSCPRAIAEGLKAPCLMEGCKPIPNCHFNRADVVNIYKDERITHPAPKPKSTKTVVLSGIVDVFTGFGQTMANWAVGLSRLGWDIQVKATRTSTQFGTIPEELQELVAESGEPAFVFETHDELLKHIKPGQIVATMWEAPRVSRDVVDAINKARALIVPSTWCATSFSASGVTVPIRVVPLGINTRVFKYTRDVGVEGVTSFGCSGRIGHGPLRKGLFLVEEAFKLAFPGNKGVRLNIKVFEDCPIRVSDDRVTIERRFLTDEELADWYRGNIAHVSACRSGAWELQTHQSMGVGCCPIASKWSGQTDYLEHGRFTDFSLQDAQDHSLKGYGVWAEPSVESLAAQMIWVHNNRDEAIALGRLSSGVAAKFSNRRSVLKLEQVLREFGVL